MNKEEKLQFDQQAEKLRYQERLIAKLQEQQAIVQELQQTNRILGTLVTIFHTWYQMKDMTFTGPK